MITLKQIDYALAVSQTLHFKKAAEVSFVSPSTLSNAITEMEKHLGFKVFERDNKKVFVTTLGAEFLKKAQSIQLQIFEIQKLVENQSDPLSSNISCLLYTSPSPRDS